MKDNHINFINNEEEAMNNNELLNNLFIQKIEITFCALGSLLYSLYVIFYCDRFTQKLGNSLNGDDYVYVVLYVLYGPLILLTYILGLLLWAGWSIIKCVLRCIAECCRPPEKKYVLVYE